MHPVMQPWNKRHQTDSTLSVIITANCSQNSETHLKKGGPFINVMPQNCLQSKGSIVPRFITLCKRQSLLWGAGNLIQHKTWQTGVPADLKAEMLVVLFFFSSAFWY